MVYGPPLPLDGPIPEAPPHRLLDTVLVTDAEFPHIENGVHVYPFPTITPEGTIPCADGTYRTKDEGTGVDLPIFGPFAAYVAETCSSISIRSQEDFRERARLVLDATESMAVERQLLLDVFSTGSPYIGDGNATILGGGAVDPIEGLALLEDAIGGTGRQGLIHASPSTLASWDGLGAEIVERDGKLYTRRGTPIAVGDGYIGTNPDGEAAPGSTQAWAYATGPVVVYRARDIFMLPDNVREALNRDTNVITYRAERPFVAWWDTALQAAVLIDRSA